jgi:hypothetical protein
MAHLRGQRAHPQRVFTKGAENGLASRWSRNGGGREQADEEEGDAEQGEGNHSDAKCLVWVISDSH